MNTDKHDWQLEWSLPVANLERGSPEPPAAPAQRARGKRGRMRSRFTDGCAVAVLLAAVSASFALSGHVAAQDVPYARTIQRSVSTGLKAPASFWSATPEARRQVALGFYEGLGRKIPATIDGVSIRSSLMILAWMYCEGIDRALSDRVFLDNMDTQIRRAGGSPKRIRARQARARSLHAKLRSSGGTYFGKCR